MENNPTNRILVIGSGGIAGFYSALLHKAGWQIDLVARSDHAVIRERGFTVHSTLGDLSFNPDRVFASTAEAGKADQVLIAVKMLPDLDLPALLKPVVGEHTTIAMIANGLDVEASVVEAFPHNPLTSCVAFVGTSRVAPGMIKHVTFGKLLLSSFGNNISNSVSNSANTLTQRLTDSFGQAGILAKTCPDITLERWKKSVWNASFNPLSVVTNGATTEQMLGTPAAEALVRALMTEVIQVAAADGHELTPELIDINIDNTRKMPPYHTSMALDYLDGRAIELDAIVGQVVKTADKHNLVIPHLRTLYEVLCIRQTGN